MIIRIKGHTIAVHQDRIEMTPTYEPDTEWVYSDRFGHVHRWIDGFVPTVRRIVDVEATDEYPDQIHYECIGCGETIEPGERAPLYPQYVQGLRHFTIDGEQASEDDAKNLLVFLRA